MRNDYQHEHEQIWVDVGSVETSRLPCLVNYTGL